MGACRRLGLLAAGTATTVAAAVQAAGAQPPIDGSAPRAARVAFSADGSIYTIDATGAGRRRLTTMGEDSSDGEPAWSPDGATLAFTRFDEARDGDGVTRIWLTVPDGTGQRLLTPNAKRGVSELDATWSPDGARIAFTRLRAGKRRFSVALVSVARDGSHERTLYREVTAYGSDAGAFLYSPAWSPDGGRILFTRDSAGLSGGSGKPQSIWVVPATGGRPARLASGAEDGAWSPDGGRIAYAAVRAPSDSGECDPFCEPAGAIFTMNADGSDRRRVTATKGDDSAPSWSGDGQRIAFHSDRNSIQGDDEESLTELYSVRPDGSCLTWLTNGTARSVSPSFEPGAGLASEPVGCGPTAREPLVETDTSHTDAFKRHPLWWLGRVSPDGLLLTDASADSSEVWFGYHDCGRFDPGECGEFVNVVNLDLCTGQRVLPRAGTASSTLSIFRGALRHDFEGQEELGATDLYAGRTKIEVDTASGTQVGPQVLDALRQVGGDGAAGVPLPAPALPAPYLRSLARVTAAQSRLHDVNAVARLLHLRGAEVRRRLAVARRLRQLGVKRRLSCPS